MKHKRNLFYIFLASAIISVLLVFVNQDVVVRGLFDKIMEAVIMTALIYIVLIVLYFLMFIAKSGANRIARKQKKDLTK
ncbi:MULTISPECIES: hypothetical protein [Flavobacterium]|jgi:uncharacterized membrane protein YhaH (DUF805 family)|uniref:Uncharacterized protein n=1 Tax=Flavobacterium lindanitolerans TaxID=428988 RepID=A0A497UYI2_9FLAO|nr:MULTISPECIES: hypothetical protein [Flavobacterium]MBU7571258.1 hypothetical protein [Flavobacterium sp.]PZO24308.1 MAG: hypothetical protein DCE86_16795 [Flavobacteriaceae bacterium]THD33400.1 MAG: hypothetical protein DI588_05535 [Flavobacterium johnsoniae]KQS46667.1 hypothetical protein ASG38_12850 [Flavobacterium sp. Leaf359]MDQ7960727.1 hypothetical protein [Flavobacterium lindanitolerans]